VIVILIADKETKRNRRERRETNAKEIIEELRELIEAKKKSLETIIHVTGEDNYPIGGEFLSFQMNIVIKLEMIH
jgi:hypothetical protein